MSKTKENSFSKLLHHIDREEIVSKLMIGIPPEQISEWLESKYSAPEEKKFHLSTAYLKKFKSTHLDFYQEMLADFNSAKTQIQAGTNPEDVKLMLANSSDYKALLIKNAETEFDVRAKIRTLCDALEQRFAAVFDAAMSNPDSIDTRTERVLTEIGNVLSGMLDKYYKFTESPVETHLTQNIQLNVVSDHVAVIQDCIRETLAQMDTESSLFFMDLFSQKMENLKAKDLPTSTKLLSQNEKMAKVEILQETIGQKLN